MNSDLKILYVDDESINLFIFKKLMGRKYTVLTAECGEDALHCLEQDASIQVVVSDMKMPGMSGLDFIKLAHQKYDHIKYFMLSGYSLDEETKAALDSGLILDYWTKPTKFEAIDEAIRRALQDSVSQDDNHSN